MPSITLKLFKEVSWKVGYYIPYFILQNKTKNNSVSTTKIRTGIHRTVDR